MIIFLPIIKKTILFISISAAAFLVKSPETAALKNTKAVKKVKKEGYPQGYFRNPMGIPIQLAANFGELRTNHFHMGLDIRTNQRENLPVYAAAEGFISRIKIESSGFGRAIYIEHPNGYTTLYAHLNNFIPALESFIKNKQYQDEKWEQDIEFTPDQFPVSKGQFIAYSGNTGASQGPHLHFEIRDTETGNNVNPWLFGFNLQDRVPPSIYRLYYYDRRYSTYQSGPKAIAIRKAGGNYSTVSNIVSLPTPYISFGISAEDLSNTSAFRIGIYSAEITVDDKLLSSFKMDDISYDETRYLNASIDYSTKISGGAYIQHLSRLPGNQSAIFSDTSDGAFRINDTEIHTAKIVVKDAAGNASNLSFRFRWDSANTNQLMFAANSIPMIPGRENSFNADDMKILFSPAAFYDTVPFVHRTEPANDSKAASALHHLHNYKVPVHDYYTLQLKPIITISETAKERLVLQLKSGRRDELVKGKWMNDWVEGNFRYLGTAKIVIDTIPPLINSAGWVNGGSLRGRKSFTVTVADNLKEIKNFKAFINDKWVLCSQKGNSFTHIFDERTPAGKNILKISVEDEAGNTAEKSFTFYR